MNHPDIARTIATGHPHGEPVTVDECTYCGQELQSSGFYIYIPSTVNYFCSDGCAFKHHAEHGDLDWVVELMLEEGTLQRRVLE